MLENQDIIYVSNAWPGDNKTSAHHIAEELAKRNRLLYVEASGQRAPRASARDYKKIVRKLRKAWDPPREIIKNVFLYSPLILPFHRFGFVKKLNQFLLKAFMRRAGKMLSFENPILWIVLPHYAALIDSVTRRGIVYYCVDEYASQPNVDADAIRAMERKVLDHADVVFAVSDQLVESKRNGNENVYLSTHGVDTEAFGRAVERDENIPADIGAITGPIAVFFGLIEEWVDLELIAYLARERPDVSFALIGSVVQDPAPVAGLKNVHFLGHKKYETLPDYLAACDVGLLPYKLNEQVINSNPKKMREYLAAGMPVVSVRVREVERYQDVIHIADDYEAFLSALDIALKERTPDEAQRRTERVADESWSAKVDRISHIVAEHIIGDKPEAS